MELANYIDAICGICAATYIMIWGVIDMSRKRRLDERIVILNSIDATRAKMPKYYPASKCGKWKSKKDYDRKDKSWKDEEW